MMSKKQTPVRTYRCPHCFSVLENESYHMLCTNNNCCNVRGEPEIDLERCMLLGINTVSPDAPRASNHIVRIGNVCDICGTKLRIRVCPRCHHTIPLGSIEDCKNTIMFLAPHNGGLSHYLVSVIQQMRSIIRDEFNGNLSEADDATRVRMSEDYVDHIKSKTTIPSSEAPPEPMVYYLDIQKDGGSAVLTLVFVDVSCGTDGMPHLDHGTDIKGMISEASGIVLLMDPETEKDMHYTRGILSHVSDLLRSSNRVDANGKIDVPLAIALSKCDLLMEGKGALLGRASAIHMRRPSGILDDPAFIQIDAEVREIIKRNDGRELIALSQQYSQKMFFAVSAIGYNPVEGSLPHGIIPFRVEDPLLWLLSRRLDQ